MLRLRIIAAALSAGLLTVSAPAQADVRDRRAWQHEQWRHEQWKRDRWERWHGYGPRYLLRPGYHAPPPVYSPPSHRLLMQPPVYLPPGVGPTVPFR